MIGTSLRPKVALALGMFSVAAIGFVLGVIVSLDGSRSLLAQEEGVISENPPTGAGSPMSINLIRTRSGRDAAGSGDLIGFSHVDESGSQVISLVNTSKKWLAVYHIDPSGTIRLTSSREIAPDFMLQFNATEPLPGDIRRLNGPLISP
ncbi:MAG: hypothetical protein AAGC97_06090 [Planctomycetota bacterium]